ncbi:hypothetical protein ACS5PJ_10770 [Pseudarthrobacter sp. YS3]|uniref:hypothetical protein n=1 Tax=Pseudarthrobacter sp. YS3 TaxID=3453718 RepID=UPI003EEE7D1A
MNWSEVENEVRTIAEAVWSMPCVSEVVSGIQCDGVIKLKEDYWVLIEISVRDDLDKLRNDITKLSTLRNILIGQGTYAECFFVTSGDNHPSLRETARAAKVQFHTLSTFAGHFLGARQYMHERAQRPFGSAVIPETGDTDTSEYTPIAYTDDKGKRYNVADISRAVNDGKRFILLGEFGTGKSRCIKETFSEITKTSDAFAPIAINLRDNWGYRSLSHILRNHLDDMGMGQYADNLLKSLRRGNHPLLLDGFDEIGSQSWTGDPARLAETRRKSLEGVRDIVQSCAKSGVLITGREHYFSSDAEMLEGLGLNSSCIILRCPEEFTEQEARQYLSRNSLIDFIPDWMPRKPLICQLLAKLDQDELAAIQENSDGEVQFFESVVDAVCGRETRIHSALDATTVKRILLHLAQSSRIQSAVAETLSAAEINQAFYLVAGFAPIDESSVLLQRLPYLGRVGSGSSDRIFIDDYAKNGLRGLAMNDTFSQSDPDIARQRWQQPLDNFGLRVWAQNLPADQSPLKYVRQCVNHGNVQAAADFVAARLLQDRDACDFEGLSVDGGAITELRLVEKFVSKLSLTNIFFDTIIIEDAKFSDVWIDDCIIRELEGVSSRDALPDAFGPLCEVGEIRYSLTASRISTLNLTNGQKTLLAMIKKLFFQPGSGRKEEALLRGTEAYWDESCAHSALNYMEREQIIRKIKGNRGWVYVPRRQYMTRMGAIVESQKVSTDPLWELISSS